MTRPTPIGELTMQPQDKPTDVTDAMIDAGQRAYMERPVGTSTREATAIIYRAMRAMEAARPDVSTDGLVDELRDAANGLRDLKPEQGDYGLCDDAADRIEALQRSNAEKDGALLECAEDLEAWVKEHYCTEPDGSCHPAMQAKMDRDLAPARKARKALSHSSETSND